MVDIEAVWVVQDVGDEEPTKKGHLDHHLKVKSIKMCLFLEMGPNRDKGEGLYQCPGLSL